MAAEGKPFRLIVFSFKRKADGLNDGTVLAREISYFRAN